MSMATFEQILTGFVELQMQGKHDESLTYMEGAIKALDASAAPDIDDKLTMKALEHL